MKSKVSEYLAKAEECEARARQMRDPETRRVFEDLARSWRQLAEQVNRGQDKIDGDEEN